MGGVFDVEIIPVSDLPACTVLAQDRQWNPEERKWGLLFELGTVYGIRDGDGVLVGTTILTRYPPHGIAPATAAISMVLVASRWGGQGLGRKLMEHALAAAGDAVVFLNATTYGRPLYEKLGFVTVGATHNHCGTYTGQAAAAVSRPATPADQEAIARLDAQATGADRRELLQRLPGFAEQVRVVERDGRITGYAAAWRNGDVLMIGPVIAAAEDHAKGLILDIIGGAGGAPVRLDLDRRHPALRDWATANGLPQTFGTDVMTLGGPLPGDRDQWYVPMMQALG